MDDFKNGSGPKKNVEINAETRRIPKSLIEEQLKKKTNLDKAVIPKFDENKSIIKNEEKKEIEKPEELRQETNTKETAPTENEINKDEAKENAKEIKGEEINKTQAMSLDRTLVMKSGSIPNGTHSKEVANNSADLKLPKPVKKKSISSWIIIISIIIFAAIVFYLIGTGKDNTNIDNVSKSQVDKKIVKNEYSEEKSIDIEEPKDEMENDNKEVITDFKIKMPLLLQKIKIVDSKEINNDNLSGISLKKNRKKGAFFSLENDSTIVAVAEAFKKRVEILGKFRKNRRSGLLFERWIGDIRGFKIDAQKRIKKGKTIYDRITFITPSKGVFRIINGVLASVKKVNFEIFNKELKKRGIEVVTGLESDNEHISVNLKFNTLKSILKKNTYLISSSGVFDIKAGDSVDKIYKNKPKNFRVIEKTITVDDDIEYNVYKVHDPRYKPLFFIKEWEGKIAKIEINSESFITIDGFHKGTKLGELRIVYPKLELKKSIDGLIIIPINGISGYYVLKMSENDFDLDKFDDSVEVFQIVLE